MPNQSTPPVFPQSDLPPLPPEFLNVGKPAGAQPPVNSGPLPPITTPPLATTSPKKKYGGGRIIATILGFMLLVGGIIGGVVLTQQQQDVREKAKEANCDQSEVECWDGSCAASSSKCPKKPAAPAPAPPAQTGGNNSGGNNSGGNTTTTTTTTTTTKPSTPGVGEFGYVYPGQLDNGQPYVAGTYIAPNGERYPVDAPGTLQAAAAYFAQNPGALESLNMSDSAIAQITTFQTTGNTGSNLGPINCSEVSWDDGITATVTEPCPGGGYLIEKTNNTVWCTADNSNCKPGTGGGGGSPPPTNTTNSAANCQNVKAYSSTWAELSKAQLSELTAGTAVNFCVSGITNTGAFDRARFTINGAAQAQTTTKRQNSSDYCQIYTIPAGTTTFKVTAIIHHATLGWR